MFESVTYILSINNLMLVGGLLNMQQMLFITQATTTAAG